MDDQFPIQENTHDPVPNKWERDYQIISEYKGIQLIANHVFDYILILNTSLEIVYYNHAMCTFLGNPPCRKVLGKRPGEILGCIHQTEKDQRCGNTNQCRFCGANHAFSQSQQHLDGEEECRFMVQNESGYIEALDLKIRTQNVQIHNNTYILASIQDISDSKRRNALERIFFHDVLNTANLLQQVSSVITSSPDDKEMISLLPSLSSRLIEQIQMQHQLIKAEQRELQLDIHAFTDHELLDNVLHYFQVDPLKKENQIIFDVRSHHIELQTDYSLLFRVIINMVKNAIEASDKGDEIQWGSNPVSKNWIEFYCINPQVISPDIQEQLFHRSFSTKGNNRGLGTYSMKLLTEQYLKGTIQFKSSPERGTIFTMQIPCVLDQTR